jgi:hypothetical protein
MHDHTHASFLLPHGVMRLNMPRRKSKRQSTRLFFSHQIRPLLYLQAPPLARSHKVRNAVLLILNHIPATQPIMLILREAEVGEGRDIIHPLLPIVASSASQILTSPHILFPPSETNHISQLPKDL